VYLVGHPACGGAAGDSGAALLTQNGTQAQPGTPAPGVLPSEALAELGGRQHEEEHHAHCGDGDCSLLR
jgi:hypothetical protein